MDTLKGQFKTFDNKASGWIISEEEKERER